jgi:phosphatidylserine/phosphatidylglycerophosphate/cardiolipin synthase-like enzyme
MTIEVKALTNIDEATIVWRTSVHINGCRGFAIEREGRTTAGHVSTSTLDTFVGWEDLEPVPPNGTHRPSTEWPIQRFMWRDYQASEYAAVRYTVIPMIGKEGALAPGEPSQPTEWASVRTGQTPGLEAYFNRGVVAAQWLGRRLNVPASQERAALAKVIADPTSPIRQFLAGPDRRAILGLLADAQASGSKVFAALFQLDDPELIAGLKALGGACSLLLASGAYKPGKPDDNADVRTELKDLKTVQVFDRLVRSDHLAHNKFVVFCDAAGNPQKVWTGSTNWTMTGLCTQSNNGLLIESAAIAAGYLAYWQRLQAAGDGYPATLAAADGTALSATVGTASVTAWLTPVSGQIDLADAKERIRNAQQGVLFLMFIPGPKGTLLDDILTLDRQKLFVHGVINQNPYGKPPAITLVDRGEQLKADPDVVIPAAVGSEALKYWHQELRSYDIVMVHSKVVIVDPFGQKPIVMTGSHNLGPKASGKNDDNLVIVADAAGLAAEYAVNIMAIYSQYKWRYNSLAKAPATAGAPAATAVWNGIRDNDTWQDEFFAGPKLRELRFWFGESTADVI